MVKVWKKPIIQILCLFFFAKEKRMNKNKNKKCCVKQIKKETKFVKRTLREEIVCLHDEQRSVKFLNYYLFLLFPLSFVSLFFLFFLFFLSLDILLSYVREEKKKEPDNFPNITSTS